MPEKEIEFESKGIKIHGTLTVPEGENYPIAVFVHGGGPQDRDGTVGPNKMWKDIAEDLAADGIASIRFDKRAFSHKDEIKQGKLAINDLNDEILDDAYGAIGYAKTQSKDVYVIGQSLGAYLVPEILDKSGAKGGVMLAAPARDIEEIIIDQNEYSMKIRGEKLETISAKTSDIRKAFGPLDRGEVKANSMFSGALGSYWYDLRSKRPLDLASSIDTPLLLIFGEKDSQVFKKDYELWTGALEKSGNDYEAYLFNVNHMMMPCEKGTIDEYQKQGKVDKKVTKEISKWVWEKSLS
ncbi:MAG: alpha/beta hydrolase [Candidatus Aenigmarchaeota archaeon]|nr:alpha/beta hydrolase [Candidatus Aenigmarchaeota archaeon]